RTARAVEVRTARDPALCHLAHLAAGVQVALVVFGVEALFHPIAYQFYFFSVAGLAVALKNTYRAEATDAVVEPRALQPSPVERRTQPQCEIAS
ncbi:MAG TPA: hypothetical protein VIX63_17885, partial [Vicinamibacterales bacterium]